MMKVFPQSHIFHSLILIFVASVQMFWHRNYLKFSDITDQLQSLTKRFDDFIEKYNILHSELLVSKNCNSLLLNRIINLERNAPNNAQHIRREMLEINPVPQSNSNDELEQRVCRVLSLTGTDWYYR